MSSRLVTLVAAEVNQADLAALVAAEASLVGQAVQVGPAAAVPIVALAIPAATLADQMKVSKPLINPRRDNEKNTISERKNQKNGGHC